MTVDDLLKRFRPQESVACPRCGDEVDMTDCENLQGHVTYWGDDEAQAHHCSGCSTDFFIKEHVSRSWTAGRTADEADK